MLLEALALAAAGEIGPGDPRFDAADLNADGVLDERDVETLVDVMERRRREGGEGGAEWDSPRNNCVTRCTRSVANPGAAAVVATTVAMAAAYPGSPAGPVALASREGRATVAGPAPADPEGHPPPHRAKRITRTRHFLFRCPAGNYSSLPSKQLPQPSPLSKAFLLLLRQVFLESTPKLAATGAQTRQAHLYLTERTKAASTRASACHFRCREPAGGLSRSVFPCSGLFPENFYLALIFRPLHLQASRSAEPKSSVWIVLENVSNSNAPRTLNCKARSEGPPPYRCRHSQEAAGSTGEPQSERLRRRGCKPESAYLAGTTSPVVKPRPRAGRGANYALHN